MKTVLLSFFVMAFALFPSLSHAATAKPSLYVVSFAADWCGSCKVIEPNLKKARMDAKLDNGEALFVTLDYTDKMSIHQSGLLANAIGIGATYKQIGAKTGFVLLIDAETGETVGRITKDMDAASMAQLIKDKV